MLNSAQESPKTFNPKLDDLIKPSLVWILLVRFESLEQLGGTLQAIYVDALC